MTRAVNSPRLDHHIALGRIEICSDLILGRHAYICCDIMLSERLVSDLSTRHIPSWLVGLPERFDNVRY
jgi:hypothetical protein